MATRRTHRRRGAHRRTLRWILGAAALALVAAVAWVGIRGAMAYGHLADARQLAAEVVADAEDGSVDPARVDSLAREAAAAYSLTSDPVWAAVAVVPGLGDQMRAVTAVTGALASVSRDALPPLLEVMGTFELDAMLPGDGRIDVSGLGRATDAVSRSARIVSVAADRVDDAAARPLVGPLDDAVGEVSRELRRAADATDMLARASTLVPTMLGAEERNYLLLFQNNAELRSQGGIVGALMLVTWRDGRLTITQQAGSADFGERAAPVADIGDDARRLFDDRPALFIQNVTQMPQFADSGRLAKAMWEERFGTRVDGVLAVDPVVLSYVVEATGPLRLPDGREVAADEVVDLALHETYLELENAWEQDDFFAEMSAAAFDAVFASETDARSLLGALARGASERRALVWSSRPHEQDVLSGTTLAGGLGTATPDEAELAILLNDGTGGKMGYFLSAELSLGWTTCSTSSDSHGDATLVLRNEAPSDAAELPWLVTGGGNYGVPPGTIRTVVYVVLPEGFRPADSSVPASAGVRTTTYEGRPVVSFAVDLAPGESVEAVVGFAADAPPAELSARLTPTAHAARALSAPCG